MTYSSLKRSEYMKAMQEGNLDLLVIGGGITGAGIALDAVTRGLNIGLIEMQDFAAGTSSRSTKLVHGGLRYLKQFEVKLVAEVGKERAIVYENAPHVTTPVWMLLPFYKGGTFGTFSTSIGLRVYDFLAGVKREERRSMLNKEQTLKREPLLKSEDLKGGGVYVEYRTDDARLTLETMKAAVAKGAKAVNYVKAENLLYDDNGKIIGVEAVDQISGERYNLYAKKIVNAAGPWVDTLREIDHSKKGKMLHLTKGVHLVIDGERFPLHNAVYFDTPNGDGRMLFAIPREGKVYIGTTDTNYKDDPKNPKMTKADRDYILEAVNGLFPSLGLTKDDVESSWAGVRPLIHEEGKSPSEISRKDEMFHSDSGLITIAGGKLTGYRKMAEKVVDFVGEQISKEEGRSFPGCQTKNERLSGGDIGGSDKLPAFIAEKVKEGKALGLTEEKAEELAHRYGSNIQYIYSIIKEQGNLGESFGLSMDVYAVLRYSIDNELTVTPLDFFLRRTGALLFNIDFVYEWKKPVIDFMANEFNWTSEVREKYEQELDAMIKQSVSPEE
ncbi:glycerol-3-phosphate dehydrogenase [Pullulanibacillus pueri]|uniref:Glycerol-3-phosphate dehydrogenase n=1 Tax=Pullulanibacillus pueri TaxID=1437324 RepID=A0A8J3EK44_9BACL|nr:FAD-dependent oxidoreductase [Pullulanibacillus pueri]MBM7680458.1 glycerol-3-phosphate dehydrogenase [Pullulanibacillus pueri]GGH74988.1 glycerol-3-phosphate dehydrogenase [Pullulanibacillus pueri]